MGKTEVAVFLVALVVVSVAIVEEAEGKKVRVPDELEDVVDDEEDEEWKAWGRPKKKALESLPFDPPPDDLFEKHPSQIQDEMLKRHVGTSMGFVKLRLDVPRTKEETPRIAKKWTDLLRTGSINAKIMAVDVNTIMFIIEQGQDTVEVKDFVLSQPEAYEFKIGQNAYRRPGDPPLEVVIERLQKQKSAKESAEEL